MIAIVALSHKVKIKGLLPTVNTESVGETNFDGTSKQTLSCTELE